MKAMKYPLLLSFQCSSTNIEAILLVKKFFAYGLERKQRKTLASHATGMTASCVNVEL